MITETWQPIPSTGGLYEASDVGRIRSLRSGKPYVLSSNVNRHGYLHVTICVDGRKLNRRVHQLVAEAFVGPRPDALEVRHRNGDQLDNRPGNLAYGTRAENAQDTIEHGTHHHLRKTRCPKGHAYDEANTKVRVTADGAVSRACRQCARDHMAARYRAKNGGLLGGSGVQHRSKTHCPQNHPYDTANTYRDRNGKRHCRACHRERARRTTRTAVAS